MAVCLSQYNRSSGARNPGIRHRGLLFVVLGMAVGFVKTTAFASCFGRRFSVSSGPLPPGVVLHGAFSWRSAAGQSIATENACARDVILRRYRGRFGHGFASRVYSGSALERILDPGAERSGKVKDVSFVLASDVFGRRTTTCLTPSWNHSEEMPLCHAWLVPN